VSSGNSTALSQFPSSSILDGIKAEYRDGVLALFLPRAESDKPRSIKLK
jgi:HSP20 family protein